MGRHFASTYQSGVPRGEFPRGVERVPGPVRADEIGAGRPDPDDVRLVQARHRPCAHQLPEGFGILDEALVGGIVTMAHFDARHDRPDGHVTGFFRSPADLRRQAPPLLGASPRTGGPAAPLRAAAT